MDQGTDSATLEGWSRVTAVSVCPTCAVPVIVGAPVAALLAALETRMSNSSLTDPPLPSLTVTFTVTVPASPAPSGAHRRVSYPVSDSMSCRRRARVPVPGAEGALRSARTDGLGDRFTIQPFTPTPPALASYLEHLILPTATASTRRTNDVARPEAAYIWNPAAVMLRRDLNVAAPPHSRRGHALNLRVRKEHLAARHRAASFAQSRGAGAPYMPIAAWVLRV